MDSPFVISPHALQRFTERYAGVSGLGIRRCRRVLYAELQRGVLFATQWGHEELYLLPCGVVAAVVRLRWLIIVKTVLTYGQAVNSVQALLRHRSRAA